MVREKSNFTDKLSAFGLSCDVRINHIINSFDAEKVQIVHYDQSIDACGLNCPLPLLKCKQALGGLKAGDVLLLKSSDEHSKRDIAAFCRMAHHALIDVRDQDGEFHFYIKKNGQPAQTHEH